MKITAYNEDFHLNLSSSTGVIAYTRSGTSLASNSPLPGSGSGSTGSGPQAAPWDHRHPSAALFLDHGNAGAAETIDLSDADVHRLTLDANCTITLADVSSTIGDDVVSWVVTVELVQDAVGGRTVTWPGSVDFGAADDQPDATANAMSVFMLQTDDGGTTWQGYALGGSGGGGSGTPASTVTDETTLGISPAVGTSTDYARADHTHGSSSTTTLSAAGFVGELLVADTPAGSPLVFDDLIQNEAGTDLIYADV